MAYPPVYSNTFVDVNGVTIKIDIGLFGYLGTATPLVYTDVPVMLYYELQDQILSAGCKLNIVNTLDDLFELANLVNTSKASYDVAIYKNAVQVYSGKLIEDVFTQQLSQNRPIVLPFSDELRHLQYEYPAFLLEDAQYLSKMLIIYNCLRNINNSKPIYFYSKLVRVGGYNPSIVNPYDEAYIDKNTFIKESGEYDNSYVILNKVLAAMDSYLYSDMDQWYVERQPDKGASTKLYWVHEHLASNSDYTDNVTGITDIDLDNITTFVREKISYTQIPALKEAEIKLNFTIGINLMDNNFPDIDDDSTDDPLQPFPERTWKSNQYLPIINKNASDGFIDQGIEYDKPTPESNLYLGRIGYSTRFTRDSGDETVFTLTGRVFKPMYNNNSLELSLMFIMYDSGNYYYAYETSPNVWALSATEERVAAYLGAVGSQKTEWEFSKTIDLSGLLSIFFSNHVTLYIIFRPIYVTEAHTYTDGILGDFKLVTDNTEPDNLITAALNNDRTKTKRVDLDLFDTGDVMYINNVYYEDSGVYYPVNVWQDDNNSSISLQDHIIITLGNYYNEKRGELNLEWITPDIVHANQIFKTSLLKDELLADARFDIKKMTYDIKNAKYNLTLKQYISNIGKEIGVVP